MKEYTDYAGLTIWFKFFYRAPEFFTKKSLIQIENKFSSLSVCKLFISTLRLLWICSLSAIAQHILVMSVWDFFTVSIQRLTIQGLVDDLFFLYQVPSCSDSFAEKHERINLFPDVNKT